MADLRLPVWAASWSLSEQLIWRISPASSPDSASWRLTYRSESLKTCSGSFPRRILLSSRVHWHCFTAIRNKYKQGNRRYQTSPALCNPTAPFTADRPHHLLPEIFGRLFALAWHTEWSLLLHGVIGDWMIPFAANAAATLQRRPQMLLNGPDNSRKLPIFLVCTLCMHPI